ncbi:MAG: Universal stress protein family [Solirubrobacteraceae bacterium]|nr:Universal stress protein family [Solirubrobacteraceae bacterium]
MMNAAPRRILAAVRAHGDDRAVVRYAADLATALGGEMILVGVAPIVPVLTPVDYPLDPFSLDEQVQRQEIADRLAREQLDELAATLDAALPRESGVSWGSLGPATVEAAREHDADLVVIAMRARDHELGHVLHDHADRYVLHHCDVPVLVVPTGA